MTDVILPPTKAEVESTARTVVRARAAYAITKEQLRRAHERFEREHAEVLDAYKVLGQQVQDAEGRLRQDAVALYRDTKNRIPVPGVTIRMEKVVTYAPDTALGWAKQMRLGLKLDAKAFEALVKAGAVPSAVATVAEEPKAQLSEVLGDLLGLEPPPPEAA